MKILLFCFPSLYMPVKKLVKRLERVAQIGDDRVDEFLLRLDKIDVNNILVVGVKDKKLQLVPALDIF